jgi:large subunit ribosomal protein L22
MKAYLKNYRQSPRKVRLVIDSIRGKKAEVAVVELSFLVKRASDPILKLLKSAIANAKQNDGVSIESLFVKEIQVNQGPTLKRSRARARGSAFPINKRTSNVTIVLGDFAEKTRKKKEVKAEKTEKKTAVKKAPVKKAVEEKVEKKTSTKKETK